ncbi:hypothetical protein Dda_5975 [Drechslerella dactyloides]|uniref:Uncharacterized protein n=1 Tax=Drechslerella dactyloides TaxID=74499 RepID=A0AAD6IV02_DREDA|nr:hypothetical protein Dda_5975 [Drechslerella dactyloides]
MSRNLSDDEDMTSSTPSSPSTPVTASANPHIPLPPLLDLKTPPQSQDNTPYASRTATGSLSNPSGVPASATRTDSVSSAATAPPTLQTGASSASAAGNAGGGSFVDEGTGDITASPTRRRPSGAVPFGSGGTATSNGVSVMPSSEPGVPAWLTKRGLEEIANVEERLLDRQFSTHMYASIFSDKDVTGQNLYPKHLNLYFFDLAEDPDDRQIMGSLSMYPPETSEGTVTSWIPLETAFPSSSGCESIFWSAQGTLAAWDPNYGIFVNTSVKCIPPAATTWWGQAILGQNSLTRLSLGPITCPSAYKTVTTINVANIGGTSTFVACCPPDYTIAKVQSESIRVGIYGLECSSVVPAGKAITFATRNRQGTWFLTTTSYTTVTQAWGVPINGYNIADQITSSASTTSTIGASTTAGTSLTTNTTPTTPATPTTNTTNTTPTTNTTHPTSDTTHSSSGTTQPSFGLSTGAIAGIGVGVAFGALALGALITIIFLKFRAKRKRIGGGEDWVGPI